MADKILTNFMYDRYYSEYKTSAIRKFIPIAFTKEELDMILMTELEGVVDKVYFPSIEDIKRLSREQIIRKITPYAYSNKASSYPAFTKKIFRKHFICTSVLVNKFNVGNLFH